MEKIFKTIKAWTYIGWVKKMTILKKDGYTYDKIYKDRWGRRCAKMYKWVEKE
jgi:hypothetical protein